MINCCRPAGPIVWTVLTSSSEQGMPTSRSLILRQVGAARAAANVVGLTVTPPASALLPASGVMIVLPPAPVPEDPPEPVPEELPVPVPEELPVPVPEELPVPAPEELPVPVPEALPVPVPEELPAPVSPPPILPVQPTPREATREATSARLVR